MVIEKTLRFPKPHPFPSLHQKRYPIFQSIDLDRILESVQWGTTALRDTIRFWLVSGV